MPRHIRNPGLSRHARLLNCSAGHLSQVIAGSRQSPDLLQRYRDLTAAESPRDDVATVEAGIEITEPFLPAFFGAQDEAERSEIRGKVAAALPSGFVEAYGRCARVLPLRTVDRFAAIVLPFFGTPRTAEPIHIGG